MIYFYKFIFWCAGIGLLGEGGVHPPQPLHGVVCTKMRSLVFKGLVPGSCIAGFCYCLHFTQIQQIAIKIPCLVHFW
jgi:hypothetical protein